MIIYIDQYIGAITFFQSLTPFSIFIRLLFYFISMIRIKISFIQIIFRQINKKGKKVSIHKISIIFRYLDKSIPVLFTKITLIS